MKTITQEVIDHHWDRICSLSDEESERLVRRMLQEQPFIMLYLLAADEQWMAQEERGRLQELGAIVWEIMSQNGQKLRQVSPKELEAAEDANTAFAQQLDEGPEMQFQEAILHMMANYNQMPLLGTIVEALMEEYEEAPSIAPDGVGMALLHLKTVIDCLDQ
jgi:hypothetical protein